MSTIKKFPLSAELGRIASNVLLPQSTVPLNLQLGRPMLQDAKKQSTTDNWLREAMIHSTRHPVKKKALLYLPTVLKTLQRLRSSDKIASYFALLNKIKSSQIEWIGQSGKLIQSNGCFPLEFYHEFSTMLYRMSLKYQDPVKLDALTRFTLDFMTQYQNILNSKTISSKSQTTRFYKNCISLIVKEGSLSHFLEALSRIPPERQNLKRIAELAFYQHTSQLAKAFDFLEGAFLDSCALNLESEEIAEFFPLFFNISQSCILNGAEDLCCKLLNKLSKDWKYEISLHDFTILRELSERHGSYKVLVSLEQLFPNFSSPIVPWKTLQNTLSWQQFMTCLNEANVDLFKEDHYLDFLQLKLSEIGSTTGDWIAFLEETRLPDDANESLKAFWVHSISSHLVANKNIGFFLTILEHMIYRMDYGQHFLDTNKLAGQSRCSNFHLIFRAISNNSSSVLTADLLLNFLMDERHRGLPFSFDNSDFYCMMKSCLSGTNQNAIYYFLYHFFLIKGHTLFERKGDQIAWSLPSQISMFLENYMASSDGDRRAFEVSKRVEDWYLEDINSGRRISENVLRHIFGDEYIPTMNLSTLRVLETKVISRTQNQFLGFAKNSTYSPSVDMLLCERLRELLNYTTDGTRN